MVREVSKLSNSDAESSLEFSSSLFQASSNDVDGKSKGSGRVSFGPSGKNVAYARRTSNFDKSLTIDFGATIPEDSDVNNATISTRTSMGAIAKNETSARRKSIGFRTAFALKGDEENFRISKNPTQMKLERIEAFFYNHGTEIALGVLFLSLNVLMAAHGAYQFSEVGGWTAPNKVLAVTLPIARAGGRLVTLNCALLLLTACKYIWTLIRTYVAPVVPIGFPIDDVMPKYHRYVALTIIFSGCIIHTLPQIVNYSTRAITMDHEGMRLWTFGDGFATKQLLLTGTLLVIIFSTFFFTTLQVFRKTAAGFRWFWTFHITGIATAYPLLIIHGTCRGHPIFLYVALLPLALYIFDASMRRKNIHSVNILRWRVHDDDGQQITELVLERPKNFSYTPGQYAELKFAPISTREWHPFTIASSPGEGKSTNNEIVFYIKNAGRWTGALMDYASAYDLSKSPKSMQILIRGPHGAPAMNYTEYKHILVIGSGVGVTPLLSIWNYLMEKGKEASLDVQGLTEQRSTMVMKRKSLKIMENSTNTFNQSKDLFTDQARSRRFLMEYSQNIDFFGSQAILLGSLDDFDASFEQKMDEKTEEKSDKDQALQSSKEYFLKFRSKCIFMAMFLESMTVSLPIFVLFVLGETMAACFQLAGWYLAANVVAASLALIALMVHGTDIVLWTVVAGPTYFKIFKGWLELAIVLANSFALWLSIRGCMMARGQIDTKVSDFKSSLISIGFVILFQAIRIFHIFYMTLKVQTSHHGNTLNAPKEDTRTSVLKLEKGVEFCSVDGIVINRKYSNMKFAARNILPKILQEGLSDVFSMEFYGTREKPKKKEDEEESVELTQHSLVEKMMGSEGATVDVRGSVFYNQTAQLGRPQEDFFRPSRPDWNNVLLKAISKAHATNEDGESVGVFFCGSPAIAHALQIEARKVTAQHQFAMKCLNGKRCRCKIIVHSENF